MRDKTLKAFDEKFQDYLAIGEAVAVLLHPYGEVVLHDVASGRIARIWNAFSNRKAGDPSHLEGASDLFTQEAVLGPYEKALNSQVRTKSMTAALYDAEGAIMGFFCVNLDISIVDAAMMRMLAFTQTPSERMKPISLNDLEQQINYAVRDYLLEVNKTTDSLTREERVALVGQIEASGLFHARNSVKFVGNALGLSRASVYNLLSSAKDQAGAGAKPVAKARAQRARAITEAQVLAEAKPRARRAATKP